MLKKISTLLILIVTLSGCSKDDDKSQESTPPVVEIPSKKYVDRVITTENGETLVTKVNYNNKMQVISYVDDNTSFNFQYENDRVVAVMEGEESNPYSLYYTDGVLSGIDHYSQNYSVTYNSSNKTYSFDGTNFKFGLTGRDILFVNQLGSNTETFTYDTSKKGPLYNLDAENIFPITLFANFQYFYMTVAPIRTVKFVYDGVTWTLVAENIYDDEGYLTEMTLRTAGEEEINIKYEYIVK